MAQYNDIEIKCGCGERFIWTAGEQRFLYSLKEDGKIEVVSPPKRCQVCLKEKREKYGR